MEGNNYLTSGDLAMWDTARTSRAGNWCGGYGDGCGYGYHGYGHRNGAATTGVALGASALGVAVIGALAVGWGVNQASKARARGAENMANANSRTVEMLANIVNREAVRQDGINIDVTQSQRAMANAFGTGGSANALAQAEAYALLQNNANSGLNSAVGGCNYLRVARVSGSRLCGCDTCNGEV